MRRIADVRVAGQIHLGLLVAFSLGLPAQEVTGALQGRVVLSDSRPAVGALLTLTGTYLQGPRTRVAGPDGFFQVLALPPGTYALRVTRIGARPLVVDSILVSLGRTTGLGILRLEIIPVSMESVRINASRLTVDPVRTTAGGVLYAEDYANLPTERDFKAIIPVLPQVNVSYRGDAPNVAGSTGLENQYFIDGVNTTDARSGARATSLPHNFVRAVEVKAGGYEAQFGRALGAVVNAVTYSGTNEFEANAFAFLQPDALSFSPRPLPGVSDGQLDSYDIGVRLGGPVVRDRLWYSLALNPRRDVLHKEVSGFGRASDRTSATLFASKLTLRATTTSSLELSIFGDPSTREGVSNPTPVAAFSNVDPLLFRDETGGVVASLRGTFTPTTRLLIETSFARQRDRKTYEGRTARGRSDELFVDYVQGTVAGGLGESLAERRARSSAALRATLLLANHTMTAGAEYDIASTTQGFRSTGKGYIDRVDSAFYVAAKLEFLGRVEIRSPALFLQDTWRIGDRLAVNAGMRWSGQYFVGANGRTAQRITGEWQPRAGLSWMLDDAGRQRVFASYGRYYQALPTNLAARWFADNIIRIRFFDSDPRQAGATELGVEDLSTLAADYSGQIPGLKAEHFDEFTVGFERQISQAGRLTLRGMRRTLRSTFQWGRNDAADPPWVLGTPGKGDFDFLPAPKRDYTALELGAEGEWRSVQYRASYILSRTWGNYPGLFASDFGYALPGLTTAFYSPNQAINSTGYLPTDRRHVAKLSGWWTPASRLTVGAFATVESGTPLNEFAAGPAGAGPSFLVPRGSVGRTPWLSNIDLRVAFDLPRRGGGVQSRILVDLLRVGNPRRATRVGEWHYDTLDADGNPASPNPAYGQPAAYQPPMAVRVGLEVKW